MKSSAIIKGVLKYAVGLGLLAYILNKYWEPSGGNPGIRDLLQQTPDYTYLALAGVAMFFTLGLQFTRWYLLVRALDLPFTPRNALRLGLIGYYYNTFLPGSIGGDFVKSYFIAKEQPDRKAAAVATVLVDRLLGLFGLLLFSSVIGGACWYAENESVLKSEYLQRIIIVCGSLVGGAILGWLALGVLPERRADRFAERLTKLPLGKAFAEVWNALRMYRKRPRVIYLSVPISAVSHTCMVLAFHCVVRVYPNVNPCNLAEHFIIAPIGFIAQAFFPAPGGVGGAEAVFGYLYERIQHPDQTGAFGRFTLRAIELTFGFIGFLVFLTMKNQLPTQTEVSRPTATDSPVSAVQQRV